MKKQRFNPEEYSKLKHRVEALQSRVRLDSGPEQETAKLLLDKVEKKLKSYEETHEIPEQQPKNYSTTTKFGVDDFFWDEDMDNSSSQEHHNKNSWNPKMNFRRYYGDFEEDKNYYEDTRSETEMINDLGILYVIFGSTYQTVLNYHVYKIRFKKQISKNGAFHRFYDDAFYRVYADIYEDNIRINKDVIIGFWPHHVGDYRCGDMECGWDSDDKYSSGCPIIYSTLLDELKDIWNFYFDNKNALPMFTGYELDNLENGNNDKFQSKLNKEQRKEIIDKTENEIDSGKMKYLESGASEFVIKVYKNYNNLSNFLDESGVVYKVETSGVYIWDYDEKQFGKLVGYDYNKSTCRYCLYLILNRQQ